MKLSDLRQSLKPTEAHRLEIERQMEMDEDGNLEQRGWRNSQEGQLEAERRAERENERQYTEMRSKLVADVTEILGDFEQLDEKDLARALAEISLEIVKPAADRVMVECANCDNSWFAADRNLTPYCGYCGSGNVGFRASSD